METVSTEVTLIWRRNDTEKSTWRTHRNSVDFESRNHVEISTSDRCHNFHVDSPFKIDEISTNFPCGISTSNRWRIDEDVSIGKIVGILFPDCQSYFNFLHPLWVFLNSQRIRIAQKKTTETTQLSYFTQ